MIRAHVASSLRRAGRIAIERPRTALWTLLALTCALFVVGAAALAGISVDRWAAASAHETRARMVVYLGDATQEATQALVSELRAIDGVERVELVSAEESARRLVASLGADTALLEGIDVTALPASLEVELAPGVRDVVAMSPKLRALTTDSAVAEVVVEDEDADRVAGVAATVRRIAWTGAVLFAVLALVVILAAIRVRLDARADELRVVRLLGGSPAFVIVPRALAGAFSGLAAALLAVIALQAVLAVYGDALPAVARATAIHVLGFVGVGAALGLVGGALAGASRVAR